MGAVPALVEAGLDLLLDLVGELVPAAGEELDPVVGHRVVRRRDHHAEVDAELGGQVGDGGRGQDAQHEDVEARAGQAGDRGGLEELATGARITTHDGTGARAGTSRVELAELAEDVGGRPGQVQREVRRQVTVGQPPHPIRAEQRAHVVPPASSAPR